MPYGLMPDQATDAMWPDASLMTDQTTDAIWPDASLMTDQATDAIWPDASLMTDQATDAMWPDASLMTDQATDAIWPDASLMTDQATDAIWPDANIFSLQKRIYSCDEVMDMCAIYRFVPEATLLGESFALLQNPQSVWSGSGHTKTLGVESFIRQTQEHFK